MVQMAEIFSDFRVYITIYGFSYEKSHKNCTIAFIIADLIAICSKRHCQNFVTNKKKIFKKYFFFHLTDAFTETAITFVQRIISE